MRMHSRYSIGFAMAVAAIALAPAEAQVSNDSPMAKAIDRLLGGGPRWAPVGHVQRRWGKPRHDSRAGKSRPEVGRLHAADR